MTKKTYSVIDLFCGCGGFTKGFELSGFETKFGIDFWEDALNTYRLNNPNVITHLGDISLINGSDILKQTGLEKDNIDVIIGGPPCQGFSLSGKRMIDDPRNKLYKSFVSIVGEIKPKIFVMENVPGLVRLFDGKIKDEILQDFRAVGYKVSYKLLSAEKFGVPQQRKRVFFVGLNADYFDDSICFSFPEETFGIERIPYRTTKDAISDLDFLQDDIVGTNEIEYVLSPKSDYQRIMRQNSNTILNHVITLHKEQTKSIIAQVPDGGNYKDLPKDLWKIRNVNIAWTRMNSNKPCFTIDTGHNHHFHYRANRVPTVRESARIQSFPDSFHFWGIKTSQLKQVGNAVPPLLAKSIADEVRKVLEKKGSLCTIIQNNIDAQ